MNDHDIGVLVIGDDDLLGRALERALIGDGYRVIRDEAAGGLPPDLVVLGRSVALDGWPKGRGPLAGLEDVPLLVVESSPALDAQLASWAGPLAYLAPPFGGGQFLAAVRSLLRALSRAGTLGEAADLSLRPNGGTF